MVTHAKDQGCTHSSWLSASRLPAVSALLFFARNGFPRRTKTGSGAAQRTRERQRKDALGTNVCWSLQRELRRQGSRTTGSSVVALCRRTVRGRSLGDLCSAGDRESQNCSRDHSFQRLRPLLHAVHAQPCGSDWLVYSGLSGFPMDSASSWRKSRVDCGAGGFLTLGA